jgi:hypothetical protein
MGSDTFIDMGGSKQAMLGLTKRERERARERTVKSEVVAG